jgi:hypothetical protein
MLVKSPFGKLDKKYSLILIILIVYLWLFLTDTHLKLLGLLVSLCYSLLEFCWIGSTVLLTNEEVAFRPFDKNRRKPKTVII